jgi:hypothetical protein
VSGAPLAIGYTFVNATDITGTPSQGRVWSSPAILIAARFDARGAQVKARFGEFTSALTARIRWFRNGPGAESS